MITDDYLLIEKPHPCGGVQRIYRFKSGMGLSVVNSKLMHSYPFAWEAAVLEGVKEDGTGFTLSYNTSLTEDVEVFATDEEANAFIHRAANTI